jgi:mRNA-degrading endonuclease toxin of MazEF toxin-antitoxin module
MPVDCVIHCDQLQTLPRHKLGERVTELTDSKLSEVERALLFALGFRPFK